MTERGFLLFIEGELARRDDLDTLVGLGGGGLCVLDGGDNLHAGEDLAKDDVAAVEPGGGDGGDEELGPVGVGPGVGHREQARLGVVDLKVLVVKLAVAAVDRLAAAAVARRKVTTLDHKAGDHTVERRPLVSKALLASRKSTEVLHSLGHNITKQAKHNTSEGGR